MHRPAYSTLFLAAFLCLFQLGLLSACGGCARHDEEGPGPAVHSSAREGLSTSVHGSAGSSAQVLNPPPVPETDVRPEEAHLSQEAQITSAYLILLQAMSHADEDAAVKAAEILATGTGELALPVEHWIEGALWFMERKSVNAIPYLRAARQAQPEDVHLLLLYSEALSDHNFAKEALAALNAYLTRHKDNPEVLMQKGIILFKDNKPQEAIATFESIGRFERTGFVEYYHARALMTLGQDAKALQHVRAAIKLLPDFGEALALQAFLCERTGELKEARSAYEKLLKTPYAPKDIVLRLINISLKLNQPTKALDYYQQGPGEDTGFKLMAASLFTEFRHYLQAERILKSVAASPDAPAEVYLFLADLTYEQRRDLTSALKWLDHIPNNGDYAQRKLLLTAQLQTQAGSMEAALATIRSGKDRFPASPDFVNLEARILSRQNQREEAIKTAQEGVARWPDNMELAFLLGTLLAENGQTQQAFAIMEGIIAKDNSNYLALNYVGYTLANENRDVPRALTLLTRANALAPNQFYILDSLAWAHYRAGNLDEAWKYIRKAVQLDSDADPEIWEHYGDIALSRGLHSEAREAYRKALLKNSTEQLKKKLEALSGDK